MSKPQASSRFGPLALVRRARDYLLVAVKTPGQMRRDEALRRADADLEAAERVLRYNGKRSIV